MAKALKQILSDNQAKLKIDLSELFGVEFPNDSSLRQLVGQAIIDKIVERTGNKIGADGKRFKNYSTAYSESVDFLAFGKEKNDPNLNLTGEMLGSMDIIEESGESIVIGWDDPDQAGKAHGNITGQNGKWDEKYHRDFLGLTRSDIKEIKSEFARDIAEASTPATAGDIFSSVRATQGFVAGNQARGNTTFARLLQEILNGEN